MNHWLAIPHEFTPMLEPSFAVLCSFCGGRRYSSPHYDHIGTWTRRRLLANTTGLDGPSLAEQTEPSA